MPYNLAKWPKPVSLFRWWPFQESRIQIQTNNGHLFGSSKSGCGTLNRTPAFPIPIFEWSCTPTYYSALALFDSFLSAFRPWKRTLPPFVVCHTDSPIYILGYNIFYLTFPIFRSRIRDILLLTAFYTNVIRLKYYLYSYFYGNCQKNIMFKGRSITLKHLLIDGKKIHWPPV